MSDMSNDAIMEVFLFESSTLLDQLDETLLRCEKSRSLTAEEINEVFRVMHTIKGSSAMMDFTLISSVTHKLEDTFYHIRENGIAEQHFSALFDVMLEASDFLKSQLAAISAATPLCTQNDTLLAKIADVLSRLKGQSSAVKSMPESAPPPLRQQSDSQRFHAQVLFDDDCGMENLRAFMLLEALKNSCKIVSHTPADIENNPETAVQIVADGFSVILETTLEQVQLQQLLDTAMHVKSAQLMLQSASGMACYDIVIRIDEDCGMENLRAFMLLDFLRTQCNILDYAPADIETNPETAAQIIADGFYITLETALDRNSLQNLLDGSLYVQSAKLTPHKQQPPPAVKLENAATYEILVRFDDDCGMENLRAFMLTNTLRQSGCGILTFSPANIETDASSAAEIIQDGFLILLESELSSTDLQSLFSGAMHVKSAKITPVYKNALIDDPAPAPAAQPAPVLPAAKAVKQNLISVSLSKLDALMDIMGELVITESILTRSPDLKQIACLENFDKSARQLRKLTDELQDMIMSVRMVPVAGTFQKMHRIVRDICRGGKQADLITMGEEIDIDKTIVDGISDPIMHLVRNAMDHGVEPPEERIAAGKSPTATITLSAQNTGGEVLITVSDDGRGLDTDRILEKAEENGVLTKPAGEYTEKEIFMLLCTPGFSTKEEVTEYSGRGVGMDVVKKNVEKIGGTLNIESRKGFGTSMFLKIPLTLAIVDGMEIAVGGDIFTLPITVINQSFKAGAEQVFTDIDGNEMILQRGNVYPLIRLHELYNIPDAVTKIEDGILIWVTANDRSACLFVDDLLGEQRIVVKPLPLYLNHYQPKAFGISGCTILGTGNISLILDVAAIIAKKLEKRLPHA